MSTRIDGAACAHSSEPPEVIFEHAHPAGACYLARVGDRFVAGRSERTAQGFASLQDVYDTFRPFADRGEHWAWNLCYFAADYL